MIQQNTSTPPPLPPCGKRKQPQPMSPLEYVERHFIPSIKKSTRYLAASRRVARLFGEFVDDRMIGNIDSDSLSTFASCLYEDGYSKKTAGDCRIQLAAIVRHYAAGTLINLTTHPRLNLPDIDWNDGTLLRVVFEDRYVPEKLSIRSSQTRRHYRMSLVNLDDFLGHPASLADLTDQNIAGMLTWLVDTGRAAETANNRRDYLLAFWRWCARKRLVEQFPDVDPLPQPATMPTSWSPEQLAKLFTACENQSGKIAGVKAADWWTAIHLFWWDSGERIGATLKIEWEHFDPAAGQLCLPGTIRKANKLALYDLKPRTVAAIESIRQPERKLMFELPGCLGTFYNHYARLLKDAGLPHGRHDKPQKMRRSFASHLEAAGGNATDALQHSSRSVTNKSYLDLRVVKRDAPNRLLFDIGEPSGETNGKAAPNREESGNGKGGAA